MRIRISYVFMYNCMVHIQPIQSEEAFFDISLQILDDVSCNYCIL